MYKITKDIRLAAAYLLLGAKLVDVDRTDPRHQEFKFFTQDAVNIGEDLKIETKRIVDLDKIEKDWVNGELTGNLFEYAQAFQRMKSIIHSR